MSRDEIWFINKERKLWHRHLSKGACAPARAPLSHCLCKMSADTRSTACMNFKTTLLLSCIILDASPTLKHRQSLWHIEGHAMYWRVSSTVINILHRWGKPIKYNTMRVIVATYLILVDEEKHDRQNFQEEDEQEQDKELWRHKVESEDKWVIELIIYQYSTEGQQRRIIGVFMWRLNELDNKKKRKPACLREK